MDDTLKTVIFGFLGMIVFHSSLEKRAGHDATREVEKGFRNTGTVHTRVEPRGMFGVFASQLYAIDVYGNGLKATQLPFIAIPRSGWKGHIRHLRLHFDNLDLQGLTVDTFDADIPNVTYDLGHALYRDRLLIRGAGEGPAYVRIGASGLRTFILKKYSPMLTDVDVAFRKQKVVITGKFLLFGSPLPFVATAELEVRAERYVNLKSPVVAMNSQALGAAATANILKQINPVLDISADVGLAGYITLSRVEIGDEALTIFGRATIPIRRTSDNGAENKD
jgi:hypothetical protein